MLNDPLGDLLTRIRNGQMAKLTVIRSPHSKHRVALLEVLKGEGYIRGYNMVKDGPHEALDIELKYVEAQPAIREISRVSRPGRRVYTKIKDVPRVYNGLGISIISTPRGVMSDRAAREANVGGEILCRVF